MLNLMNDIFLESAIICTRQGPGEGVVVTLAGIKQLGQEQEIGDLNMVM